ncbi:MAG: hypothetical protein MI922_15820, partial [Bacteroidales bacterium]|nr:hypothetical protein [Bacteroidales bacterium]
GFINDKATSKKLTIKENTVVADFALPYLCCSDCSPIMFCVPEQDTSSEAAIVFLPDDTFCQSPGKEEYFNFTLISPEDGIINGPGVSGDTASGFKFNPHDDEVSLGEVVFTVNDKSALKVEVIEAPVASFSYTKREGTDADEKPITILTLSNASTGADTYTWVFGDVTKELASTADFDYDVPAGTASPITVSLTASNKKCSDTDSQDIDLATTEVFYIKLDKTAFCDQDSTEYDIKFGSDVHGDETVPFVGTIEGTGILAPDTDNSTYRFAPKQATAGTHTINYLRSGTTVASIDVTVEQQFSVNFKTAAIPLSMDREIPTTIQFAFNKITPSGTGKYRWSLNGDRFESRSNNTNFNFEFIIEKLMEFKEMEFSLDVTIDPCFNSNSLTIENPLILDNEKCADKLVDKLKLDLDYIKTILESKEIPDNIKERIVVPLRKLIEEGINGLSSAARNDWLEGKYNGILYGQLKDTLKGIEEVIHKYGPDTTEATVSIDMLKLSIQLVSRLLACQYNDIETSSEIINLIEHIKELITFLIDNKFELGYKEVDREAMAELIIAIMTKPTLQLIIHRLYLDIFYRDK